MTSIRDLGADEILTGARLKELLQYLLDGGEADVLPVFFKTHQALAESCLAADDEWLKHANYIITMMLFRENSKKSLEEVDRIVGSKYANEFIRPSMNRADRREFDRNHDKLSKESPVEPTEHLTLRK